MKRAFIRRSKRYQPLTIPTYTVDPDCVDSWPGDPIAIRDTKLDDLWDEEQQECDDTPMQTTLYGAFDRTSAKAGIPRGKRVKETYKIGDTVLVSTYAKHPSVAVIVSMWETELLAKDDDDKEDPKMRVKVHWFLRPIELARERAKRDHAEENEIYFSLQSTAILTTAQILCRCVVSSQTQYPHENTSSSRRRPSQLPENHKDIEHFYCHLAIDSKRGLFYMLDWDQHHRDALSERHDHELGTGDEWNVAVDKEAGESPRKKRKVYQMDSESGEDLDSQDNLPNGVVSPKFRSQSPVSSLLTETSDIPETPSKKRTRAMTTPKKTPKKTPKRTSTATTPRRGRQLALPTPHSKSAIRARAQRKAPTKSNLLSVPQEQYRLQIESTNLPKDPWLRAMHVLHVAARPDALPCREDEFGRVLRAVEELLEEGSGGCIYISGVPGTGKTATVHAVVRELKRMAEENETNPFTYVEINGLKIPEPSAAYALLWESVSGHDVASEGHLKISAKEALKQLGHHFSAGVRAGPRGHACVVLMDELDQLVTPKQEVIYNFFNWPTLAGSKLIVLAVANTMDLPERVMTGRVRSRLGMIRITFQPYDTLQLEKILRARLLGAKEGLKGNVPDVIAVDGVKFAAMKVASISGDARRVLDICRRTVELVQPDRRTARTEDVKNVIKVMQNSPTAAFLRECTLHERIMLASLLKCIKREGVDEIKWGDVTYQHLIYMNILLDRDDPTHKPTPSELSLVLDSLLASRAILMEDGTTAARKAEGDRRVVLNLEQTEVERVLGEEGGQRWKNALCM